MADAFLEERTPYIIERGGVHYIGDARFDPSFEVDRFYITSEGKTLHVDDFDETYHEDEQRFEYSSPKGDRTYYVYPLTIENFRKFFPEQIRTFKDDFDLRDFVKRNMKGVYVADDPEFMYAVTVDDGEEGTREVLELIRMNAEGDMEYRDNVSWIPVVGDEEMPTIYDRHMIFIATEDESTVVELWDSKEQEDVSIMEADITDYAALV